MGLTIYYQLTAPKKWSIQTVREKLEALRQACLDLPVVEVSELGQFEGKDCEPGEDQGGPFYLAKIQSSRSAISPWQPGSRYIQYPSHMLAFSVWPARGCDEMDIGIASYPPLVCPKRTPMQNFETYGDVLVDRPAWSWAVTDARSCPGAARVLKHFAKRWKLKRMPFSKGFIDGCGRIAGGKYYRVFVCDRRPWSRGRGNTPLCVLIELRDCAEEYVRWRFQGTVDEARILFCSSEFKADMDRMQWGEEHIVPGETGTWTSSCKTQYANDPREGGISNFLRATWVFAPFWKRRSSRFPVARMRRRWFLEETRREGPG